MCNWLYPEYGSTESKFDLYKTAIDFMFFYETESLLMFIVRRTTVKHILFSLFKFHQPMNPRLRGARRASFVRPTSPTKHKSICQLPQRRPKSRSAHEAMSDKSSSARKDPPRSHCTFNKTYPHRPTGTAFCLLRTRWREIFCMMHDGCTSYPLLTPTLLQL